MSGRELAATLRGLEEPKRLGRKPLPDGAGKTARVQLKTRTAQKAAWQAKADAAGLTLNAWIERVCDRAK